MIQVLTITELSMMALYGRFPWPASCSILDRCGVPHLVIYSG